MATGLYIEPKTAVSPPNLGILTIFRDLHVSQRLTSPKSPRETPSPTSPGPGRPPFLTPAATSDASGVIPTRPAQPRRALHGLRRRALRSPNASVAASAGAPVADGNAPSHPLKHLSRGMGHLSVIMKRHDTKDRMKP